jgi:hypothetical protein
MGHSSIPQGPHRARGNVLPAHVDLSSTTLPQPGEDFYEFTLAIASHSRHP